MRVTANVATFRGFGYTGYAGVRPADLAGAARFAKNVALFLAAPFIGLAYAAAFPFVLRCWERWFETLLVDDRGGTKVREHWAAHHERCLPNAPKPPCLAWVKPRQGQTLESVALGRLKPPPPKSGALALAHDQAVGTEDLAALLELGVPILLWPRHRAASAAQLQGLKAQLKQAPHDRLQHLPLALHSHRVTEIGACPPQPCDFSLLWDTPGHPGLEQRDYDPSSLDAASLAPPTLDPEPQ